MKIPPRTHSTINAINDTMPNGKPRLHFGISGLGNPCDRWLWINFRWAVIQKFSGRMLRLFRRGQDEEDVMIADLRRAGVDIINCGKHQQFLNFGCHIGGSPDGLILSGLVESPRKVHVAEFKTHGDKSFRDLEKKGVKESKPMHHTQMNCYMYGHGLEMVNGKLTYIDKKAVHDAYYHAVNKNDDHLYGERVKLDTLKAETDLARGKRIVLNPRMPEPMTGASPDWYKCQWCPAYDLCFGNKKPEVNCRTCIHSTPMENSTWFCERYNDTIPQDVDVQLAGCRAHVIHPDLVPDMKFQEYDQWNCRYDGKINGEKGVSTMELLYGAAGRVADVFEGEMR